MYIIKDTFRAEPGKARELVSKFKAASNHLIGDQVTAIRILTDVSSGFWTVVWEFTVPDVQYYFEMSERLDSDSKLYEILEGYHAYVREGRREIYKIEEEIG